MCVVLVLVFLGMGFWESPVARSEEPIYFGQVMPYSGFFKPVDEGRYRGVEMAVRDLNAKGGLLGRPVEILKYDMKSDPYEMRNLADDPEYAEIRADLHYRLIDHINSIADPFFTFKATDRSGKELQ